MNLIDLEAFISVVDHGSTVAAAARLHLTQSAVTRRIQNLENALGTPLLDRRTRPVQPTRAGQETYEFAKPVLSSVNDLKAAIMDGGALSGDFRFGMPRGLGDLALGLPIRDLRAKFPKLQIQAFMQWSEVLMERLSNRTLDAAFILLPEGSPAFVAACDVGRTLYVLMGGESSRMQQPSAARNSIPSAYSSICLNSGGRRIRVAILADCGRRGARHREATTVLFLCITQTHEAR
jgi:DNA-binding transcriptional LysR family regulator